MSKFVLLELGWLIVNFHRCTRTNEYAGMLITCALNLIVHHANVNEKGKNRRESEQIKSTLTK